MMLSRRNLKAKNRKFLDRTGHVMSIPRSLLFDTALGEARASVTNREAAGAAIGGHDVKKRKIQPGILTSNVPVESSPPQSSTESRFDDVQDDNYEYDGKDIAVVGSKRLRRSL